MCPHLLGAQGIIAGAGAVLLLCCIVCCYRCFKRGEAVLQQRDRLVNLSEPPADHLVERKGPLAPT